MTRINVVPVDILSDKHLLAEYKEITRPFNKVIKRFENGTFDQANIPEKYCLGSGHETFFFDKLSWLMSRYESLHRQLVFRGVNVNSEKFNLIAQSLTDMLINTKAWNDYNPTQEAFYLNMARLAKRSGMVDTLEELNKEK